MPMYFPDLKSVRQCALDMRVNEGDKKYNGIIPNKEGDLIEARKQLGEYFRTVWKDELQAMEIELALTKENYTSKMQEAVMKKMFG